MNFAKRKNLLNGLVILYSIPFVLHVCVALCALPCFCSAIPNEKKPQARHPIHITLTNIDYNAKTHSLELSCKIFMDDFETILNRVNNIKINLGADKEHKDANAFIFSYIKQHLQMAVNGKTLTTMQFLGKEFEVEAVWMYVEIPLTGVVTGNIQSFAITNTLLLDLYEDQSNLMNLQISGKRRSALFRKGKEGSMITFD